MSLPTSWQKLGKIVQSTDGTQTETYTVPSSASGYHLGVGLSPAQPSDWINVADGAFPVLPPAAPTTGTGTGFSGGGLTASAAYNWALTNVTDYGETPAGVPLVVPNIGSFTGYVLNLPTVAEGTTDNPIRRRRLYRTAAGGAQLKYVGEIADLSLTTWRDGLPDSELGDNVPTTNTSGVTGTVTLSGGGVSVWTERSPTTAQASLASGDFIVNRQTGALIHATADYARTSVTVTWSGSTLNTSSLGNDEVSAIRDLGAGTVQLSPASQQSGSITIDGSFAADGVWTTHNIAVSAPASSGYSTGCRIRIYDGGSDAASLMLGVGTATFWFATPAGQVFKWYAGTTVTLTLDASGNLSALGSVGAGTKFVLPNQTLNAIAGTGNIANEGAGLINIPIGTTNATLINVPNTQITAKSMVFLQLLAPLSTVISVAVNPAGNVVGTSFQIEVLCSGATTSIVGVHYFIVN